MDQFDREAKLALELAPNNAEVLAQLGFLYAINGQWEQGIKLATKGLNLNPGAARGWAKFRPLL
jgi:tetratricopeptide (TPR) repeat protein